MIDVIVHLFKSMFTFPLWDVIISFLCMVCCIGIILMGVGKRVRETKY